MTQQKPKIIAVSSFKGGTAKTSTALHLGSALAKYHNLKVLLIDFDAQANLTAGLGFDPDDHDSLATVLQKKKHLQEIKLLTSQKNLDLVPADTFLERVEVTEQLAKDRYSHEKLKEILQNEPYDVILIDTPPSLCWLTESALIAADYTLVCTTPEFYSVKGLHRLAQFIENINQRHALKVLGVSVSFWNQRGKSNSAFLEIIENAFPNKLLNQKIRRDIQVTEAAIYGKPLYEVSPSARAAQDYKNLTKELLTRM